MNLHGYYYLEYFCAFLTACSYTFWLFHLSRMRTANAREAAGLLFQIRVPRFQRVLRWSILILQVPFWGFFLFDYFWDGRTQMSSLFNITFLFFQQFIFVVLSPISVTVFESGLAFRVQRPLSFIAWKDIQFCQWKKSAKQLRICVKFSEFLSVDNGDAERALPIIGQYVEVQNERGEIMYAGLPKKSLLELDAAKQKPAPFRNPFQFSILTILLLTVVVAAASGWYAVHQEYVHMQQKALDALSDFSPSVPSKCWFVAEMSVPSSPHPFTDQDVALLKPFHRLRDLSLTQSAITDAAIPDLIRLQSLRSLSLSKTKITPEGLERLRREMPNTEISY